MKWASIWQEPNEERASHSRLLALAAFIVVSWVLIRMELREATQYELVIGYLVAMVLGETSTSVSRHRRDVDIQRINKGKVDDPDA